MKLKKIGVMTALLIYLFTAIILPVAIIFNPSKIDGGLLDGGANGSIANAKTTQDIFFTLIDEPCMVDFYNDSGSVLSYSEYIATSKGNEQRNAVLQKTQTLAQVIQSAGGEVRNYYADITVGVSATVSEEYISAIEKTTGAIAVQNVTFKTVSNDEELQAINIPTTLSEGEEGIYASQNKGVFVNDTQYQGEGSLVAILDSGFNVNHNCLRPLEDMEQLKINEEEVKSLWESSILASATLQEMESFGYENAYVSTKVPYVFDYAHKDFDVMPLNSSHGMHVTGIVAGTDKNTIVGVVPYSQVALMKVFYDNGFGASMEVIMSALSDALLLGADVANLSLGISAGMSREYDNEQLFINQCMLKLYEGGVIICAAVGNEYSTGYLTELGETSASYPDNGITSSTASYVSNYGVGSVDAQPTQYAVVDGSKNLFLSAFVDTDEKQYDFSNVIYANGTKQSVTYEYVYVGLGQPADYVGKDVTGKLVLVDRGIDYFTTKYNVARQHGACAMLLINNEYLEGFFQMDSSEIDYPNTTPIPAYIVEKSDSEIFDKQNGGTIVFSQSNKTYMVSNFSTWGPNSDLAIKPEILGYGGSVYSASIDFKNMEDNTAMEYMSGTSMATPNVSALCVALKQHLKTDVLYGDTPDRELVNVIKNLLASTATPLLYPDGSYFSIRHQGAGLANIYDAINSPVYLTATATDKAKIEIGDDPTKTGKYTLDATLYNFAGVAKTYAISLVVQTAKITQDNVVMTEYTHALDYTATITVDGIQANTVTTTSTKNSHNRIKIKITLSEQSKEYLNRYPNGAYVEGFLILTDENNNQVSLPWLAFFGEWDVIPFMDLTAFDNPTGENLYIGAPMINDENGKALGLNLYAGEDAPIDLSKLSLSVLSSNESRRQIKNLDLPMTKTVKSLLVHIENQEGAQIGTKLRMKNIGKSSYIYPYARVGFTFDTTEHMTKLNAGETVCLSMVPDLEYGGINSKNVVKLNIYIDGQAPAIQQSGSCLYFKDGKAHLKLTISEDFYLMYVKLEFGSTVWCLPLDSVRKDGYQEYDLDVSEKISDINTALTVIAYDYALNASAKLTVGGNV